jgi:hypothetical protein
VVSRPCIWKKKKIRSQLGLPRSPGFQVDPPGQLPSGFLLRPGSVLGPGRPAGPVWVSKLWSNPTILDLAWLSNPSSLGLVPWICIIFASQAKVMVLLRTKILVQICYMVLGHLTNNSVCTSNVLLRKKQHLHMPNTIEFQ